MPTRSRRSWLSLTKHETNSERAFPHFRHRGIIRGMSESQPDSASYRLECIRADGTKSTARGFASFAKASRAPIVVKRTGTYTSLRVIREGVPDDASPE
jgi:hypothetical protein